MGTTELLLEFLTHHVDRMERLKTHLSERKPDTHLRSAVKDLFLASRAVIDSVIDTLGEESDADAGRETRTKRKQARQIDVEE